MTPVPARCVACGHLAPSGSPICATCRRCLAHVCYGKHRQSPATARAITLRERELPGKEYTTDYQCPVCSAWHNGRSSMSGRRIYADAVLICLRLVRFHGPWLAELAGAWRPEASDRAAWRASVSPSGRPGVRVEPEGTLA